MAENLRPWKMFWAGKCNPYRSTRRADRRSCRCQGRHQRRRGGAAGEEFSIRVDFRDAAATTDSASDACREWGAPKGGPVRLLRVLRGPGGPDGPSRQLLSQISPTVLCHPQHQSGGQTTLPSVQSDRNSRRSRQKGTSAAQRRGMAEAMAVARRVMPGRSGDASSTRATRDGREGRVTFLTSATGWWRRPPSCTRHAHAMRTAAAQGRARNRPYMR